MKKKLLVSAQWDEEAGVWVATSDDIPGLVTEAKTIDDLVERVKAVSPELIEDNAHLMDGSEEVAGPIDICLQSTFELPVVSAH